MTGKQRPTHFLRACGIITLAATEVLPVRTIGWLTLPNLYLGLFLVGLGMTVAMLVLGLGHDLFGGIGHDVGGDVGHGDTGDVSADATHHDAGGDLGFFVQLFSPSLLAIFLTVFGGVGYLAAQSAPLSPPLINIPISLGAALFVVFGVFVRFQRWFRRAETTSHPTMEALVGTIGESLSPIPPKTIGSIAYTYAGIRHTAPARNRTENLIPRGAPVRIVDVVGNLLVVESAEEPARFTG